MEMAMAVAMAMAVSTSSSKLLLPLPLHASSSATALSLSLSLPSVAGTPRFRAKYSKPTHLASSFINSFAIDPASSSYSGRSGSFAVRSAPGKFERKKPHVNIGTIGHADHGETNPYRRSDHGVGLHVKQRSEEVSPLILLWWSMTLRIATMHIFTAQDMPVM